MPVVHVSVPVSVPVCLSIPISVSVSVSLLQAGIAIAALGAIAKHSDMPLRIVPVGTRAPSGRAVAPGGAQPRQLLFIALALCRSLFLSPFPSLSRSRASALSPAFSSPFSLTF
eukprot:6187095-Pleurochrysis_carterae.AAC.4